MIPPELARQLIEVYSLVPPINAVSLLQLFCHIEPLNLSGGTIGYLLRPPRWVALVNLASQVGPQLAAAHLLGHYLLHRSGCRGFACGAPTGDARAEAEAAAFADELVMPAAEVRRLRKAPTRAAAERYGVPPAELTRRWVSLLER